MRLLEAVTAQVLRYQEDGTPPTLLAAKTIIREQLRLDGRHGETLAALHEELEGSQLLRSRYDRRVPDSPPGGFEHYCAEVATAITVAAEKLDVELDHIQVSDFFGNPIVAAFLELHENGAEELIKSATKEIATKL